MHAERAERAASARPRPNRRRVAGARRVAVERLAASPAGGVRARDWVAVEEPLEIRVEGRPFAVTLRTPGHDRELALGYLLAEGVISSAADVASLELATGVEDGGVRGDRVDVALAEGALDRWARRRVERELRVSSACGACGKPALADLWPQPTESIEPIVWDPAVLPRMLRTMRERQLVFARTGGLHAAAAFDPSGECRGLYEDVGRHNAVDKLVGSRARLPRALAGTLLVVSGRAGSEIVQKAAMAGAPAVIAVGAASSLAVEMAARAGIELVCFAASAGAHRHVAR